MNLSLGLRKRKVVILAALALGALALGVVVYYMGAGMHSYSPLAHGESGSKEYWEDRIKAVGGHTAYAEFVGSVSGKDSEEEHEQAHIFGDALYKLEGQAGLVVCDGQVSYGCYHSMVGHAIEEHGLSEVSALVRVCLTSGSTSLFSCQHGIGHGIVGHLGYTKEDLTEALALCKSAAVPDPIDSCYAGAFMEYSMRTMLGAGAAVRPADDALLAPCDSLGPEYQYACAFQQSRWWLKVVEHITPDAQLYAKLGALCDQMVQEPAALRACYEGLGGNTPGITNYVPDTAASLCAASSASALHRLYCTTFAASTIADTRGQDKGHAVCAGLSGAAHTFCTAYVFKRASSITPLPAPAL